MTARKLIIECGAAQTRATLIVEGVIQWFWFGPALNDTSQDNRALSGRDFIGRVQAVSRSLNAAFVDIGGDKDCFVPLSKTMNLAEGALIELRIIAPARQSKGPTATFIGLASTGESIGRSGTVWNAPVEAAMQLGAGASIVTDDAAAVASLLDAGFDCEIKATPDRKSLFTMVEAEAVLGTALSRRVPLKGGGSLYFSETQALTAIDIDTGDLDASSEDRLREKTIQAAAKEVALQILRRNLAGRIAIDFPSVKNTQMRERCRNLIQETVGTLPRLSSINISRGNFTMLTIERHGLSLWEETTEELNLEPVPGRQYKLDWIAACAFHEAEARQRAQPGVQFSINAGHTLYGRLENDSAPFGRYAERHGRRLLLTEQSTHEARTYDISEN